MCRARADRPVAPRRPDRAPGAVSGLLCFTGNAGIGMFAHEIDLLSAAVEYLRR
jgi:hypothetical protein